LFSFTTKSDNRNCRIAGNVVAAGGAGNDIRVMIAKENSTVYDSGRRRTVVLSVDCSEAGQYVLIFDNTFSLVSPKVVSGKISMVHWGVDEARNAKDREDATRRYGQASSILKTLFATLKRDEQVLGTDQLSALPNIRLDNDPSANARANWGTNTITINKGLFQLAERVNKSQDVLATVIAHELSHIFYRHPGYGSGPGLKGLLDELQGVTALDRVQEKEADILGLRVACQAGFDPDGMLILMRTFAETDRTASSFLKNHPSAIERFNYLQSEVAKCQGQQNPRETTTAMNTSGRVATTQESATPEVFRAQFITTKGNFVVEVYRDWAPIGADRFYRLVKFGFYDDGPVFRVISGVMAQFGINVKPQNNNVWENSRIKDDPVKQSNERGYMSFAASNSTDSRTTQVFINLRDNVALDRYNFAPFGKVIAGMEVVDSFYSGYGQGPDQSRLATEGQQYLDNNFPRLDSIKSVRLLAETQ
jgi:peptidyl-prolyl cis-trans isomerase A (cyclophilin A)